MSSLRFCGGLFIWFRLARVGARRRVGLASLRTRPRVVDASEGCRRAPGERPQPPRASTSAGLGNRAVAALTRRTRTSRISPVSPDRAAVGGVVGGSARDRGGAGGSGPRDEGRGWWARAEPPTTPQHAAKPDGLRPPGFFSSGCSAWRPTTPSSSEVSRASSRTSSSSGSWPAAFDPLLGEERRPVQLRKLVDGAALFFSSAQPYRTQTFGTSAGAT